MAPSKKAGKKSQKNDSKSGSNQNGGVAKADWADSFKKKGAGVSDMTLLSTISNDSINDNLKKRFENSEIYTYIGHVLISVNPFRMLPIYGPDTLNSYKGKNRLEMPPHVYAVAESMYYNMMAYSTNQCAGKTEAAKKIMEYIAAVAGEEHGQAGQGITGVKDMSAWKVPRDRIRSQWEPVGAMITNYLLEKGRIVGQIDDERNFHIFYQFTKGASPQQREEYGIQDPSAYYYTSRAGCLDVPQMDDVDDSMAGNVQYAENDEGNAYVVDESVVEFVGYLLEVDVNLVKKALTSRTMETQRGLKRGSVYEVPLNMVQAAAARDALAKAVYNNLFEWIVARVNISMKSRTSASYVLGVLDIYGFEIFEHNSFEQLCINYVNERLQQIFIELTLKKEQEEYAAEQITWAPIKFFNNKIVCDLIDEKRPPGIFAAMNDATATAHADSSAADNSFSQRTSMLASNPHFEARGNKFLIKHYAGDVLYDIQGMTDKNKDALGKDLLELVQSSSNSFITGQMFTERIDANSKKRPPSQGDKIKLSANALVEKLMRSQPSYIRTIKPNQSKSPTEYDSPAILHQIKYLGLQENIRIRRAGFAYRNTFEQVVQRFYLLSPATSYAGDYIWNGDSRSGCEKILKDVGIAREEWQMGTTKAFIKNPETLFALEHMRDRYWHNMAARIQRAWRNFIRYRNECATRIQRAWRNNKEGIVYLQLREAGHQALVVEKNDADSAYWDHAKKSALGEMLYSKMGLSAGERVVFSAKAQILVSKLGRSSKLSPRFLILTDRAVYILITQLVAGSDGQKHSETVVERKINVSVINSVGLSNLRDDWIVLNVSNSEEQDPLLSCVFKTEFVTRLKQLQGSLTVNIGPTMSYRKKKDKMAVIKFQKDETVQRGDVYKSQTVSVPTGLPATSVSSPFPKKKPGLIRPITTGKLLRKGGPSENKPRPQARPAPQARPLPGAGTKAPAPGLRSAGGLPPPPPPPLINSNSSARAPLAPSGFKAGGPSAPPPPKALNSYKAAGGPPVPPPPPPPPISSNSSARAPTAKPSGIPTPVKSPPPPPPPPIKAPNEPEVALYLAICAFETEEAGEIGLSKGDLVEVIQEADSGWWLIKKGTEQGWAPSNYLQPEPRPPVAPSRPAGRPPPGTPTANSQASATRSTTSPGLGLKMPDSSSAPVSVMPGMGHVNGLAGILAAKRAAAASETGESQTASSGPSPSAQRGSKGPPPPPPKPKPPTLAPKPTSKGPGPPPPILANKPNSRPGGNPGVGQMDLAAALAKRAGRTG
ncbi:hypothetical protein KEM48_000466 [Puccinia striiformis f. sp. tritici PST-130]|nr:hypothetical protein KEM48_000466 [Puccinia striiformis f. sp. tritici PST-130]